MLMYIDPEDAFIDSAKSQCYTFIYFWEYV